MKRFCHFLFLSLLLVIYACADASTRQAQTAAAILPTDTELQAAGLTKATFASGCFWCTEAVFERVKGVNKVISGYSGGPEKNPTYEQVGAGLTGHAEAVQVYYDPQIITYPELLQIFFATHDPTTLNRQGPDVGRQYRSAVFYHNDTEKQQTQDYIKELAASGKYANRIVTEIKPFAAFWPAEAYHQDYYQHHPDDSYIVNVSAPKVHKFEKEFKQKLKPQYQ
ncbi:MAG: peptide-methionine (S)-S-oxide reductase [Adhaeribacter sp.]|jgi:peptide-methionine (S)-S-oxide reductase|nr:peptide-methionine (S)-S-oxide reductase [Adhaeribacter sp.]